MNYDKVEANGIASSNVEIVNGWTCLIINLKFCTLKQSGFTLLIQTTTSQVEITSLVIAMETMQL